MVNFAYKQPQGVEDCLFSIMDKHRQLKKRKKGVVTIFLDVAKAFDSVDQHYTLLQLVKYTNNKRIVGIAYELMRNQIRLKTMTIYSHRVAIQNGILQGSVISPCLFTFTICCALSSLPPDYQLSMYADDMTIQVTLEQDISKVFRDVSSALILNL